MKRPWHFLITLIISCCLQGCFRTGEVVFDDECINSVTYRLVTYSGDIAPLVQAECSNCHAAVPANGASEPLATKEQVDSQLEIILDYLARPLGDSRHMPPGYGLSECQLYQFDKYKLDGRLE